MKEGLFLAKLVYEIELREFLYNNNNTEYSINLVLIRTNLDNIVALLGKEGYYKITK